MLAPARSVPERRASTGRAHGSKTKSPQEIERPEIQSGCEQERRKRDASPQTRDAEARQKRSWWQGKEPQASDRDRAFRSAQERREGAAQAHLAEAFIAQALLAQAFVDSRRSLLSSRVGVRMLLV